VVRLLLAVATLSMVARPGIGSDILVDIDCPYRSDAAGQSGNGGESVRDCANTFIIADYAPGAKRKQIQA